MTYRTRNFRALDFDFTLESDHAELTQYLDAAFGALVTREKASHVVTLIVQSGSVQPQVMIDGQTLNLPQEPGYLLPTLMSALNRAAIEATTGRLLVHASAVEADERALLFPAPMEAGKSTLAAGLLRSGYRYVTDEAVVIDVATLEVQPYPRPISLDRGAWSLLPDLRPPLSNRVERFCTEQWHTSPLEVRSDAVASPSRPGIVAFPRYEPQKPTHARAMPPGQALCELIGCTFNLDRLGAHAFGALARVVATSRCYRLNVGSLDRACDRVNRLVREAEGRDPPADVLVVTEPPRPDDRVVDAGALGAGFVAARRPGVAWVVLDDVVVYDPDTGRVFRLNDSGSLLWQVLDGETSLGVLATDFSDAFRSTHRAVEASVVGLGRKLARLGLIAGAPDA